MVKLKKAREKVLQILVCRKCGREFGFSSGSLCCPECYGSLKMAIVIR